jgi:6-phosphogluconolactonase
VSANFSPSAGPSRFHIGTYTGQSPSRGIYTGTFDPETGKIGSITLASEAINPNFLALSSDGGFLYAALGIGKNDAVAAYAIETEGLLRELNQQPAQGAGVCYVSLDVSGRNLLVANYSSGNIACFRIGSDGEVMGPATALVSFQGSGPHVKRQDGPHAHSIYVSPDNAFVYACDLGSDRIWIFHFDAADGTLTPSDPPSASLPSGAGPRHLAFCQGGRLVYCANELDATVTVFARDAVTGALKILEAVAGLPAEIPREGVTSAEIALHPSGRWLYVSNRGCNTFSVFAVDQAGLIVLIQSVPTGVKMPRHFTIDPTGRWLLVAGQEDNRLAVLCLDPDTGRLNATDEAVSVSTPVYVMFDRK